MNCKEFLSLQSEYIDGCLSDTKADEARTHLEVCPACRRTHAEMNALVDTLHEINDISVPDTLADRVLASVAPEKPRVFALPRILRSWQTYSLAACLILAVVLYTRTYDRYMMTTTESVTYSVPAPASFAPVADIEHMDAATGNTKSSEIQASARPRTVPTEAYAAAPIAESTPVPQEEELPVPVETPETTATPLFAVNETADAVIPEAVPTEDPVSGFKARAASGGSASAASRAAEESAETVAGTPAMALADNTDSEAASADYSYASSLLQHTVTFIVTDHTAEAVFAASVSGGPDAVEAAFKTAGIPYSRLEGTTDRATEYNALAETANHLAARITQGEPGLADALSQVEAEMQNVLEACNSTAVYLTVE